MRRRPDTSETIGTIESRECSCRRYTRAFTLLSLGNLLVTGNDAFICQPRSKATTTYGKRLSVSMQQIYPFFPVLAGREKS